MTSDRPHGRPLRHQRVRDERIRLLHVRLGEKAKQRRLDLGLSRAAVSALVGLPNPASLNNWETRIPFDHFAYEADWERALRVPAGWLRDQCMEPIPSGFWADVSLQPKAEVGPTDGSAASPVANELRCLCQIGAGGDSAAAEMMACRLGLGGQATAGADEASLICGLGDAELRDMEAAFRLRLADLRPVTPALDALLSTVRDLLPARLSDLENRLRPHLGGNLTVGVLSGFCQDVLGRPLMTVTDGELGCIALVPGMGYDDLVDLRRLAESVIAWAGAANINVVAGMCEQRRRGAPKDAAEVAKWCAALPGFEWIDQDAGWFWLGADSDSRPRTVARQLLAVASGRVDVLDIHDALARQHVPAQGREGMVAHDLPIEILKEVVSRYPEAIRVHRHEVFRARTPLKPEDVLEPHDLLLLRLTEGANGAVSAHVLVGGLVAELGVARSEAHRLLAASPIAVEAADGVFRIRGRFLNPNAYMAACRSVVVAGDDGCQVMAA